MRRSWVPEGTARFDWDEGNREKCQAHCVPIAEIEELLGGSPRIAPDLKHSLSEQRFIAVGRNAAGCPMFVAFTLRRHADGLLIRPISARYMHSKEIARHESEGS